MGTNTDDSYQTRSTEANQTNGHMPVQSWTYAVIWGFVRLSSLRNGQIMFNIPDRLNGYNVIASAQREHDGVILARSDDRSEWVIASVSPGSLNFREWYAGDYTRNPDNAAHKFAERSTKLFSYIKL